MNIIFELNYDVACWLLGLVNQKLTEDEKLVEREAFYQIAKPLCKAKGIEVETELDDD